MISKRTTEAEAPLREAAVQGAGRKPSIEHRGAEVRTATFGQTKSKDCLLMERVVENKGAAGVDALEVSELKDWLGVHWPSVKQALLEGRYMPQAVRRVDIPKPSGGVRTLGVPTVVDRLIQQAIHQVPQPLFEPSFSDGSFGFRPGRNAHQALRRAQAFIRSGKRWVVDIDLEKFFDRVNHDVLMGRVARVVGDTRVLKLIRRFLGAGMLQEGLVQPRSEGTPQGGPLSPLLSNILLTDLDRQLAARSQLLSLCRRLQHLCEQPSGGRARDGQYQGLPRGGIASACQRTEERRGAALGAQVPRDAAGTRTIVEPYDQDSQPRPAWLDYLLPAGAEQDGAGGPGRMGAATVALSAVAAMETAPDATGAPVRFGAGAGARTPQRLERPRSLVECGSPPHEPCAPGWLLQAHGAALAARYAAAHPVCSLNRRMRNRTYGGVGGE